MPALTTQADLRRKIRLWEITRAAVVDRLGNWHVPKGSPIGGRFMRKTVAALREALEGVSDTDTRRRIVESAEGAGIKVPQTIRKTTVPKAAKAPARAAKKAVKKAPAKAAKKATPAPPAKRAPARKSAKAVRPPAKPVPIRELFDADDATIEATLRDVYEGRFGPYTTKVKVHITREGTRVDKRGRVHPVEPSIGVDGEIFDADGRKVGYFGRSIAPTTWHYADGRVRRETWAYHAIVQLDKKHQGKGFGGEFNRRAIEWYRASGVHGIGQQDHNGYVWASQGFNFDRGGMVPDHLVENIRGLIADLRAGKTRSEHIKDEYDIIPKRFRDAADLDAQIAAAEALLARLDSTKPGEPGYPTAYEISQLGRRAGQRGRTALWLGKLLWVSADEMILNPDEGEDVQRAVRVRPHDVVVKRHNDLFDLYTSWTIDHPGEDPDDDLEFVAAARKVMGLPPLRG